MEHQREPRLGIDIGRVIIDGPSHPEGGDTAFFQGDQAIAMRTPEMDGAIDAIERLVTAFGGRAWLVSKCGPRIQQRSTQWLAHHRFFERTGMDPTYVRFCKERRQKAVICRQLAISHFIDDRHDVLLAIDGVVPHRYLFGPQRRGTAPAGTSVLTWSAVEAAVFADLRPAEAG